MNEELVKMITILGKQLAYSEVLELLQLELAKPTASEQETLITVRILGSIKDELVRLVGVNN